MLMDLLHLLPPGTPGKTRLGRILMKGASSGSPLPLYDNFGFRYEAPDVSEPIAFHLAIDRTYEPETLSMITQHLRPGDVFVDVGANIGVFTLPAAKCVGDNGRVIAAEASGEVFHYLKRNVEANNAHQVTPLNCAICDFTGVVPFYPAPREKFGMGSLGAQFDGTPIEVRAATLDSVVQEAGIENVALIKVDVEGFEAHVFKGAGKVLTGKRPPLVLFEFCDWAEARVPNGRIGDAQRVLLDHGFSIWRLKDFLREGPELSAPLETGFDMLVARHE
jgi:FkbM family methyltransferase